jgi:hypothetical protein
LQLAVDDQRSRPAVGQEIGQRLVGFEARLRVWSSAAIRDCAELHRAAVGGELRRSAF